MFRWARGGLPSGPSPWTGTAQACEAPGQETGAPGLMVPFLPCFWQCSALVVERGLYSGGIARWPDYAGLLWFFLAELRLPGVSGMDGWMDALPVLGGAWLRGQQPGCSWRAELLWQLHPQPNLLLELWCTKGFLHGCLWPVCATVSQLALLGTFGPGSAPLVLTQLQKWQVCLSLKDAAAMLGLEGTSKVNLLFYPSLKLRTSFLLA